MAAHFVLWDIHIRLYVAWTNLTGCVCLMDKNAEKPYLAIFEKVKNNCTPKMNWFSPVICLNSST